METKPYIMVRRKPFFIEEIHTLESSCFKACYEMSFNGEIPIKLKSRSLHKALDFCERRGQLRMNHSSSASLYGFDCEFLDYVKQIKIDLVNLIHAAGMLGINRLVYMLFDDVVRILCEKTPDQVEKIFKARFNRQQWCFFLINKLLSYAPPCPSLSEEDLKEMELKDNLKEILKVSPAHFTTLPNPQKWYWVYAHLLIKCNPALFISITEDAAEDEEEESKLPKANDDVGGPGLRGLAWKRRQPFDDMKNEKAYVKLRNKRVYIDKINSMESRVFDFYYHITFHGEIPIKIPKRYLGKAMEFCVERAQFQRKYTSSGFFVEFFDLKFLKNVKDSKIDLPELIHAALTLGIDQLVRLLLNDVVDFFCEDDDNKSEKFFERLYKNDDHRYRDYYNEILDLAPPCPTLSKDEQEKMYYDRERILNTLPNQLKTLDDDKEKLYWVYAHLVIKLSPAPTFYEEDERDEYWP